MQALSPAQRATVDRAWALIDQSELTELTRRLVEIPSRTGEELPIAQFLVDYMGSQGIDASLQQIDEGRANAVGLLAGSRIDNDALLLNGHLDTSFTGDPADDMPMVGAAGVPRASARIEGDLLFGLGAVNMKGGVAALVGAVSALARSGARLRGTLAFAGVAGEIEKAPIDGLHRSYTGRHYLGAGLGTRFLLEHGLLPRYAVVGEPTGLNISRAMLGLVNAAIEVRGILAYTNRKHLGRSALAAAARLTTAIEEDFAPAYAARHRFARDDMALVPNVIVGAIESGWPYKPGFTPAVARLYVDLRTSPDDRGRLDGYRELREFVAAFATTNKIEVTTRAYLTKVPGTETASSSPLVVAAHAAYRDVLGSDAPACPPESTSFSDDTNVLRQHGCDAITLGPAGPPQVAAHLTGGRGEFVSLEAIERAARMYVAIATRVLDVESGSD